MDNSTVTKIKIKRQREENWKSQTVKFAYVIFTWFDVRQSMNAIEEVRRMSSATDYIYRINETQTSAGAYISSLRKLFASLFHFGFTFISFLAYEMIVLFWIKFNWTYVGCAHSFLGINLSIAVVSTVVRSYINHERCWECHKQTTNRLKNRHWYEMYGRIWCFNIRVLRMWAKLNVNTFETADNRCKFT